MVIVKTNKMSKITIRKFGAPWCRPCQSLAVTLKEFKEKHPDIDIVDINVDEDPDIVLEHNIRSIPTLHILKEDNIVSTMNGSISIGALETIISSIK